MTTPTPDLEALVADLLRPHVPLTDLAERHGLTMVQLRGLLETPAAAAILDAHRRVALLRAEATLDMALPEAIDRLVDAMQDESASPETRRKAAGALIRLHRSTQKDRQQAAAQAAPPPPAAATPKPKPARRPKPAEPVPSAEPAHEIEPIAHDDAAADRAWSVPADMEPILAEHYRRATELLAELTG